MAGASTRYIALGHFMARIPQGGFKRGVGKSFRHLERRWGTKKECTVRRARYRERLGRTIHGGNPRILDRNWKSSLMDDGLLLSR